MRTQRNTEPPPFGIEEGLSSWSLKVKRRYPKLTYRSTLAIKFFFGTFVLPPRKLHHARPKIEKPIRPRVTLRPGRATVPQFR